MNKRDAVFALAALGAAPLAAIAQQPGKIWRIGMLRHRPIPELDEAFRQGLAERGYEQGRNIVIEYRWSDGNENFPALAAELVRLKVDLIVAGGRDAILAAQAATSTVPIVMMIGNDPIRLGIAKSFARPGGNVTGMSNMAEELNDKRLELLKFGLPAVMHVAVLTRHSADPNAGARVNDMQDAARKLGMKLLVVESRRAEDFEDAFAAMKTARVGALLVMADAGFTAERRRLVELAARNRLPTMYDNKAFTQGGGLMSYGPDLADIFRRTAGHVDKLLKGAKAAELPIEQPTRFELVVNLKTAKLLGISFPSSFLLRADRVIE